MTSLAPELTADTAAMEVLARLRQAIGRELHDYPYPIAGCDEAFKLLALQKELVRVALAGLESGEGLAPADAAEAVRDLLATPVGLSAQERRVLGAVTANAVS